MTPLPRIEIPGGKALVGTNRPLLPTDGEGPQRTVKVAPFAMMPIAVTNAQFAEFVAATDFVTEAERFGWSFVFYQDLPEGTGDTLGVSGAEWWRRLDGANWRAPNGPGSEAVCHDDHPVVQVSWNDAQAFATWAGGRLPTEAEWEWAARGGLGDATYPWGDRDPDDSEFFPCNIWQGRFPEVNVLRDGYHATAPAHSFLPNGYGLYNCCGNVWEWTSEDFRIRSLSKAAKAQAARMRGMKLMKGGSFLCHASYCTRYRIAARTGSTPDSTTAHQGFRLAFDAAQ